MGRPAVGSSCRFGTSLLNSPILIYMPRRRERREAGPTMCAVLRYAVESVRAGGFDAPFAEVCCRTTEVLCGNYHGSGTLTLDPSRGHATLKLVEISHSKLRPDEVVPDFWSLDDCAPRAALAIAFI